MHSSKWSVVAGIAFALTGLFAGAAEARLNGAELGSITQNIVHNEVLANAGNAYGQCVAQNFEYRNNEPSPAMGPVLDRNDAKPNA